MQSNTPSNFEEQGSGIDSLKSDVQSTAEQQMEDGILDRDTFDKLKKKFSPEGVLSWLGMNRSAREKLDSMLNADLVSAAEHSDYLRGDDFDPFDLMSELTSIEYDYRREKMLGDYSDGRGGFDSGLV